jgi:hypothetical protein
MEICPLSKLWCEKCGSPMGDPVCYEIPEIKKVRELKTCPMNRLRPTTSAGQA